MTETHERPPMGFNAGNAEQPIPDEAPNLDYRKIALFLYRLLDDIDTLDDSCRGNDVLFRDAARKRQQRRHEISACDGYSVAFLRDQPK